MADGLVDHVALDPANTLPNLVARRARDTPGRVYLRDLDHDTVHTYEAFHRLVLDWAGRLAGLGVRSGDAVVSVLPNCTDAVATWVATALLGAVEAPVNPAYRGNLLAHMVRLADAEVLLVAPEYLSILEGVLDTTAVTTVVVLDLPDPDGHRPVVDLGAVRVVAATDLAVDDLPGEGPGASGEHDRREQVMPWDLSCLLYTSGTTGPSKGVMVTWAQTYMTVVGCFPPDDLGDDDHWYVPFPLFHMSGRLCVYGAALLGSEAVLRRRFSLSGWWPDIDEHGCTVALMIGSVPQLVAGRAPSEADPTHALRHVQMAPMPENAAAIGERFGIRLTTVFNMTEISVATHTNWKPWRPGSVGRVRRGYQVRIVDEFDREVPAGTIGEIIVRADVPWTLNLGYWRMPDKTVEAWRNGWFHTGDAGMVDTDGWYFFVDRIKDAIRRGGENISSMELEAEMAEHPQVRECAAIGVPSTLGEEDVLVYVVPETSEAEAAEIHAFCQERLPKFMVPRYLAFLDELPKTPTEKVRKNLLEETWKDVDVWDAEEGARDGA